MYDFINDTTIKLLIYLPLIDLAVYTYKGLQYFHKNDKNNI